MTERAKLQKGPSVIMTSRYGMAFPGKTGTVVRTWDAPNGTTWVRVLFGKNQTGQSLTATIPAQQMRAQEGTTMKNQNPTSTRTQYAVYSRPAKGKLWLLATAAATPAAAQKRAEALAQQGRESQVLRYGPGSRVPFSQRNPLPDLAILRYTSPETLHAVADHPFDPNKVVRPKLKRDNLVMVKTRDLKGNDMAEVVSRGKAYRWMVSPYDLAFDPLWAPRATRSPRARGDIFEGQGSGALYTPTGLRIMNPKSIKQAGWGKGMKPKVSWPSDLPRKLPRDADDDLRDRWMAALQQYTREQGAASEVAEAETYMRMAPQTGIAPQKGFAYMQKYAKARVRKGTSPAQARELFRQGARLWHASKGEQEGEYRFMMPQQNPPGRHYSRDPKWMKARYDGKCSQCWKPIQEGDDIVYFPIGKKAFCAECGAPEYARLAEERDIEGMGYANPSGTYEAKIRALADRITRETRAYLASRYPASEVSGANAQDAQTTIKPGKLYTKVDVGRSGKYMVDQQGNIWGIKAYGVIHRGHRYGTLDTADDWNWGGYIAVPKRRGNPIDARFGTVADKIEDIAQLNPRRKNPMRTIKHATRKLDTGQGFNIVVPKKLPQPPSQKYQAIVQSLQDPESWKYATRRMTVKSKAEALRIARALEYYMGGAEINELQDGRWSVGSKGYYHYQGS